MAYNEYLADRIADFFKSKAIPFQEKKMFGGLCYLVDHKMCVGIIQDRLMARVGADASEESLGHPYVKPMDFTGRPMKGYIYIQPEGLEHEQDLNYWLEMALMFNPMAKASKGKK